MYGEEKAYTLLLDNHLSLLLHLSLTHSRLTNHQPKNVCI